MPVLVPRERELGIGRKEGRREGVGNRKKGRRRGRERGREGVVNRKGGRDRTGE